MRILIFFLAIQIFSSCQDEISEKDYRNPSIDNSKPDTLGFWIYDSLFLGKFQEKKLNVNSDTSMIRIRISQVNPIGGHSRIISFVEGINFGFSYSLKVECLNNSNYFGIGNEDSEWLKSSFYKIFSLLKPLIKEGAKDYRRSEPTKWVVEILEKGKYEYAIFDSKHMFDVPEELKTVVALIENHTKFGSDEFRKMICEELAQKMEAPF